MRNAQLPYDALPFLKDIPVPAGTALSNALNECRQAMWYLNGFTDALGPELPPSYLRLRQLSELRYSFGLEACPIAPGRLYEADSSENGLNDETALMIFAAMESGKRSPALSLSGLYPEYLRPLSGRGSLLREKKESRIYSYHTNLTLYTAPADVPRIRALRAELDQWMGRDRFADPVLKIFLCHFQIRALAPFNLFNGHVARQYTLYALSGLGLEAGWLPFSRVLDESREVYNELVRDAVLRKDLSDWCIFMAESVTAAAGRVPGILNNYLLYRKKLKERLDKYTEYPLPASELAGVLTASPFIKPVHVMEHTGCHRHTAYTYLNHLVRMGILTERKTGREKLYLNREFSDILSD